MSPTAEGQMMNSQVGMMNAAGQNPGMEIPPAAPQAGGEAPPGEAPPPGGEAGAPPAPLEGAQSQLPQAVGDYQGSGTSYDLQMITNQVVGWLNQLPDHEKNHELVKMQLNNPQLYSMVLPLLQTTAGAQQNSAAMPQPEQRPAQRGPEAAAI